MSFLGEDWKVGPDGMRFRHASRVLLFDPDGRVLLAQGHDLNDPSRQWWFTIGGGRDEGESSVQAARRELREETGIHLEPGSFQGPILTRVAIFDFAAETVRQYEEFFVAWLEHHPIVDTAGLSDVEKLMIDSFRWWDLDDLTRTRERVYPRELGKLAKAVVHGWDGRVIHIGDVIDRN